MIVINKQTSVEEIEEILRNYKGDDNRIPFLLRRLIKERKEAEKQREIEILMRMD